MSTCANSAGDSAVAAYQRGEFKKATSKEAWEYGFDATDLTDFSVWTDGEVYAMSYEGLIEVMDRDGHVHLYNLELKEWVS